MGKEKILVVDDQVDMCHTLSDLLEAKGYAVIIAREGKTALEKIEKEKPNLVLLDIRLPGMDGIQVLKRIRKINPKLPVIMITGYGSKESAFRSIELGAFEYIQKPFENQQIVLTIKKALLNQKIGSKKNLFRHQLMERLGLKKGR